MRSTPGIRAAFLAAITISLFGCGGGGGDSTAPAAIQTANANVTVNWAARTRDIDAPASAQSLIITLKNASTTGTDVAFTINRDAAPAAYKKSYSCPQLAKVGTLDLNAKFYAQPNGTGSVVGTIDAQFNLAADGTGIGDFATTGTVASVVVAPNQTLPIGVPTDIIFTAKDSGGADLAVSPGSAKLAITAGTDKLQIDSQGRANGTAAGTAKVTATVDGKTSPEQDVSVGNVTNVTISPATVSLFTNGEQGFEYKVTGPSQPSGVTFSIQEGQAGGTISGATYIAPATPGTYHIVAASIADATKRAVATVTVTGPASANLPGIYVRDTNGDRFVHMDDMAGSNWSAMPGSANNYAIGPDGKIYLALGDRIVRVDNLSGSNPLTFAPQGSSPGHFVDAEAITVGGDGKIYVADAQSGRIIRFDDMSGSNWVELSTGNGALDSPTGIQVAGGHIYYLEQGRVVRVDNMQGSNRKQLGSGFSAFFLGTDDKIYATTDVTIVRYDDMSGIGLVQFGVAQGGGTGQFDRLRSIWVTANGQIYVADSANNRIVRIDDMTGKNWMTLGTQGISNGQFQNPTAIIVR